MLHMMPLQTICMCGMSGMVGMQILPSQITQSPGMSQERVATKMSYSTARVDWLLLHMSGVQMQLERAAQQLSTSPSWCARLRIPVMACCPCALLSMAQLNASTFPKVPLEDLHSQPRSKQRYLRIRGGMKCRSNYGMCKESSPPVPSRQCITVLV